MMNWRVYPRSISAGALLAAALSATARPTRAAGLVEAWGNNQYGTLGNGTTTESDMPVVVSKLSGVTAIAGGGVHSLAVQNGGIYAWGYNAYGQIGNGTTTTTAPYGIITPVAVSGPPSLSSSVTAIAGGADHSLAVQNGDVYAWGLNNYGQLGNNSTFNSSVPVAVSGLSSGVSAVACGEYHSLAVQNGGVYSWGYNGQGQLGNNTTIDSSVPVAVSGLSSGVTAIAGGYGHSLAVQNGGVYAWGDNTYGDLGNNSTTNSSVPVAVSGLSSGVTAIAGGYGHSLAVQNGGVYAWGENFNGQLGDGTTTNHLTPEQIDPTDLTHIIAVAANTYGLSSYALSSDGTIWDWGDNQYGELGQGNTTSQYLTPQHLLPPTGYVFTAISANDEGAEAILTPVAVPEPASLSLLALASVAMLRRRCRA
jgi:alpha-tubulin suppressor-like RCC1 family protein